jgi:hypothetical protein
MKRKKDKQKIYDVRTQRPIPSTRVKPDSKRPMTGKDIIALRKRPRKKILPKPRPRDKPVSPKIPRHSYLGTPVSRHHTMPRAREANKRYPFPTYIKKAPLGSPFKYNIFRRRR